MDFFAQQAAARRHTHLLWGYFALAVALIIPIVYGVVLWGIAVTLRIYNFFGYWWDIHSRFEPLAAPAPFKIVFFLTTAGVCIVLMTGGAVRQIRRFSRGGGALATLLGGDRVPPHTQIPAMRRLLNVVEEMAIAAGLPMPDVYVLPRQAGINTFAAGMTPATSAIAVTQGALDLLKRDEIQAAIAHEFSHILHGDTRNKTILAGLLHGLMTPADTLSRMLHHGIRGAAPQLILTVVLIVVLGIVVIPLLIVLQAGALFATIIKRMASRQREWLADAAAVQFTRNPAALAGGLKCVGGYAAGGRVMNASAREVSHLFFVNALGGTDPVRAGLLGCHPALIDRIRRLEPRFDGSFPTVRSVQRTDPPAVPDMESIPDALPETGTSAFAVDRDAIPVTVGAPDAAHLAFAAALLAALPTALSDALHRTEGAQAVLFGLLLSREPEVREAQMRQLRETAEPAALEMTFRLMPFLNVLPAGRRLPLVTIAVHTLKNLSSAQFEVCLSCLGALVAADNQVSLFEYGLERMILHHLAPAFGIDPVPPQSGPPSTAANRREASRMLLACLAYWGTFDTLDQCDAYHAGMMALAPDDAETLPIPPLADCTVERFRETLDTLARTAPPYRQQVLEACVACIAANGRTSPEEAECLQIIADALDLPLPPVLSMERDASYASASDRT